MAFLRIHFLWHALQFAPNLQYKKTCSHLNHEMPPYARVAHTMGPWIHGPPYRTGKSTQGPIIWATLAYGGIA
jgi:hypothetical protein